MATDFTLFDEENIKYHNQGNITLILNENIPLFNHLKRIVEEKDWMRSPINEHPILWITHNPSLPGKWRVSDYAITSLKYRSKLLYQYPFTSGEMASAYLETLGVNDLPAERLRSVGQAPLYFQGPTRGIFGYVDITSCYFSLYRCMTLDMFYSNQAYRQGNIPFTNTDQLGMHKQIRNNVFGIMQKTNTVWCNNGKWNIKPGGGPIYRPSIVKYIHDTVQAIAQEAVRLFDIRMWLTDAAIVEGHDVQGLQQWLREEWKLESHVETYGDAFLYNQNKYIIDKKIGGNLTEVLKPKKTNTFYPVNIQRLKDIRYDVTH